MNNRLKGLLAIASVASLLFTSCSKDDNLKPPTEGKKIHYALLTEAGAYPNNTTYFQGLENMDKTHIDNAGSTEFASGALIYGFNDAALVSFVGQPATMTRYTFDNQGKMVAGSSLKDPAGRNFASLCFVGEHDAYAATVGTGGEYRVTRFDPVTMQKKGDVDISLLKVADIPTIYIQQIVKRGDKLFIGVYYEKNFNPAIDEAVVAIVDIATQKVEKVIRDPRTSRIFIGSNGGALSVMPNGDIYVMAYGTAAKPSGILRIKNNEYDFDPGYFMNLNQLTGGICRNFFPYSDTKAVTMRIEDPSDEWELKGANYSYYIIDIVNRTVQGKIEGLPVVYGSNPPFLKQINGEWLLNAARQGTSTVYSFNPTSGTVSQKFTVEGKLANFIQLK